LNLWHKFTCGGHHRWSDGEWLEECYDSSNAFSPGINDDFIKN
jgi:hypothetical protein